MFKNNRNRETEEKEETERGRDGEKEKEIESGRERCIEGEKQDIMLAQIFCGVFVLDESLKKKELNKVFLLFDQE